MCSRAGCSNVYVILASLYIPVMKQLTDQKSVGVMILLQKKQSSDAMAIFNATSPRLLPRRHFVYGIAYSG